MHEFLDMSWKRFKHKSNTQDTTLIDAIIKHQKKRPEFYFRTLCCQLRTTNQNPLAPGIKGYW